MITGYKLGLLVTGCCTFEVHNPRHLLNFLDSVTGPGVGKRGPASRRRRITTAGRVGKAEQAGRARWRGDKGFEVKPTERIVARTKTAGVGWGGGEGRGQGEGSEGLSERKRRRREEGKRQQGSGGEDGEHWAYHWALASKVTGISLLPLSSTHPPPSSHPTNLGPGMVG